MKKSWIGVLVAVVIVGLIILVTFLSLSLGSEDRNLETDVSVKTSELGTYFRAELIAVALKHSPGRPIEGFNANLLEKSLPGLQDKDFKKVDAFGGHYEVKNGKRQFVLDSSSSRSSAEQTLSKEGYVTLLQNVEKRFKANVQTKKDVDALIQYLIATTSGSVGNSESSSSLSNTGSNGIDVRIGETGSALGVSITPQTLIEDSRCPKDVECIWAGMVKLSAKVAVGSSTQNTFFLWNTPKRFGDKTVTLTKILPKPLQGQKIALTDYEFTFTVKKATSTKGAE